MPSVHLHTSELQRREGRGSTGQFVLGSAASLEEPYVHRAEQRVLVGSLGNNTRATGLPAPATVLWALDMASDARLAVHTIPHSLLLLFTCCPPTR